MPSLLSQISQRWAMSRAPNDIFMCRNCGHIYDETMGELTMEHPPGTDWDELPEGWVCPDCGIDKTGFARIL
jgi:rubredoxin